MEFLDLGDPTSQSAMDLTKKYIPPQGVANAGLAQILDFDFTEPLKYKVNLLKEDERRQKIRQEAKQDKEDEMILDEQIKLRNKTFQGSPEVANKAQATYQQMVEQGFNKYGSMSFTSPDGRTLSLASVLQSPTARAKYMPQIMANPKYAEGAKYYTNMESMAAQLQNTVSEYTKNLEAARNSETANPGKLSMNSEAFENTSETMNNIYNKVIESSLTGQLPNLQDLSVLLSNGASFRDKDGATVPLTQPIYTIQDVYEETKKLLTPQKRTVSVKSDKPGYFKNEEITAIDYNEAKQPLLVNISGKLLRTKSGQGNLMSQLAADFSANKGTYTKTERENFEWIQKNFKDFNTKDGAAVLYEFVKNNDNILKRIAEPLTTESKESNYLENKAYTESLRRQTGGGDGEKIHAKIVMGIPNVTNVAQFGTELVGGKQTVVKKDTGFQIPSYGLYSITTDKPELKKITITAGDGSYFMNNKGEFEFTNGSSEPIIKTINGMSDKARESSAVKFQRSNFQLKPYIKEGTAGNERRIPLIMDKNGTDFYQTTTGGKPVKVDKSRVVLIPTEIISLDTESENNFSQKGQDFTMTIGRPVTPEQMSKLDPNAINELYKSGFYGINKQGDKETPYMPNELSYNSYYNNLNPRK